MIAENVLGNLVYSKSGRDQGRPFVVIRIVNEHYVIISDGDTRKIENPKMKNVKHLQFTKRKANEVIDYLNRGEVPENHMIKKSIRQILEKGETDGEGGLVNG
ncbi:MAG TPA: KOW domain-containing RNA-binding protein [Syntrophomonas sp.]|nr:KOW domain-containing RNA-binding protein [Syntrophomonas sp.]